MRHHLRIVHGSPTPIELAAVTAILGALATGAAHCVDAHHPHRPTWPHTWRPHPLPHSWCSTHRPPFHRH